jgi:hypothetical protein
VILRREPAAAGEACLPQAGIALRFGRALHKSSSFAAPCSDNLAGSDPMKINRTQVIGALILAALVLLGLLLRYWKFSG